MSVTVRYWSFAAALLAALGAAVATIAAQGGAAGDRPERAARRELTVLDGRGSRLGIMVRDLEPAEAKSGGVTVDSVDRGSPAERAGLKAGDIVTEYDGERVRSARQFTRLVQETPEGREVPLTVLRDGQRQTLKVTPEARTFPWSLDIDGDRIRRDVERLREELRVLRPDLPAFRFRFDRELDELLSRRGRLGIRVESLTDQLQQYFGAVDGGALVTQVDKDSAAEKAGLRAGDVVTSVNGARVRDADDLLRELARVESGEVALTYLRDRKPGTAKATIEPREERGSRTTERRRGLRPA